MKNYPDALGEKLTFVSVALANALAQEFSKEDIFILAAFLSATAANLYLIANARLTFPLSGTDQGEAEPGI